MELLLNLSDMKKRNTAEYQKAFDTLFFLNQTGG